MEQASLVVWLQRSHLPKQEMRVWPLGWEESLEKQMATNCSILAWKIPWTEEPGNLQSMESQRVGHDLATKQQQQQVSGRWCIVALERLGKGRVRFVSKCCPAWDSPPGPVVKNLPASVGDGILIPVSGRPTEERMATHPNILVWEIPWTKPGWATVHVAAK